MPEQKPTATTKFIDEALSLDVLEPAIAQFARSRATEAESEHLLFINTPEELFLVVDEALLRQNYIRVDELVIESQIKAEIFRNLGLSAEGPKQKEHCKRQEEKYLLVASLAQAVLALNTKQLI